MKYNEIENMNIDEAVEAMIEQGYNITNYDELKEFAITKINSGDMNVALHILNAIYESNDTTDYYLYDYCMGTLETPSQVETVEDLKHLCD